ncbi:MAG TPA: nuclear transport factor 2 family protein [Ilumatobacteraceae bacterium]
MDLEHLGDRAQISDVIIRYSEALNRADWEAWTACFTPGASVDYTTAGGIAGTPTEAVAWLSSTLAMFDMRIGRVANILITVDGPDRATSTSQYSMTMRIPAQAEGGQPTYIEAAGWYDDMFERTADGWRISRRYERLAYMKM